MDSLASYSSRPADRRDVHCCRFGRAVQAADAGATVRSSSTRCDLNAASRIGLVVRILDTVRARLEAYALAGLDEAVSCRPLRATRRRNAP